MTAAAGPSSAELVEFMLEAQASPAGLLQQWSDPALARSRYYQARAKACLPELSNLQIRLVNLPDGNLALTKGARE